ncbi:MAG TPA: aminoacyl--tRNA ligase-related protein [Blastocatellia bacterium]|jgi:seryl-tRNA synthetase|nr:aminoacyl--tRNA ligase-related protein [Blastocatellia bacterium]
MKFDDLTDYRWLENGQSAFSGKLLDLYRGLDRMFLAWAGAFRAVEYRFPVLISARELARIDYFRSFPHLLTFPVALESSDANIQRFVDGSNVNGGGEVELTLIAPVRDALTPAACYHFYAHFRGESLAGPKYVTTCATCFRRESHYLPLERQWSFSMREIVCIGTAEEVKEFLRAAEAKALDFFERSGLRVELKAATDPFFNPSKNPKYLLQKLDPVKSEMVFDDRLAIGSVNFHRNYFGEAFDIRREGVEAFSGCIAFGLERFMYAFLTQFGPGEASWPDLASEGVK